MPGASGLAVGLLPVDRRCESPSGAAGRRRRPGRGDPRGPYAHKGTYGVRRVHAELRGFGHTVNRKRVERLMRLNRIEGRHLRRRKHTTVPDRFAPPAPDLVQRDFSAGHLDEKRCGDITYVQVGGSWLYPACVIDICTRGCSRRCVRRDWRSSSGSPTTTRAGDTAPSAPSRLSSSNSTTRENVESHSQHEPPCPHPGGHLRPKPPQVPGQVWINDPAKRREPESQGS